MVRTGSLRFITRVRAQEPLHNSKQYCGSAVGNARPRITRRTAPAAGNDVAGPTLRMSPPTTARALGVLNGAE
ncbi:hypothetical protein ACLKA7_011031 [Drosophila subpalustris]